VTKVTKHKILLETDEKIKFEFPAGSPISAYTKWKAMTRKKKELFDKFGNIIGVNGHFCRGVSLCCYEDDIEKTIERTIDKLKSIIMKSDAPSKAKESVGRDLPERIFRSEYRE
jgi:hypothetical protein